MLTLNRILCATDFSDVSTKAERYAVALAQRYDARLTLLHVDPPIPLIAQYGEVPIDPRILDEQRRDAERATRAAADRATAVGVIAEAEVRGGGPAGEILDAARDVDLVVIGTHGRGGFDRLMLGSVAETVMRKARCAVLIVPAAAAPERGVLFSRVLCATDGSAPSAAAVAAAVSLVRETDGTLHLLEAVEPLPGGSAFDAVTGAYGPEAETMAQARLRAAVRADVREWCRVVDDVARGKASECILAAAKEADIVVMGVRGRNALDLFAFGSTTNDVVRHAGCPVLVVHPPVGPAVTAAPEAVAAWD